MNPATEFVHASHDLSPVHAYVADHGESLASSAIDHVTIARRPVAVSETLTDDERTLVADAIRATNPTMGICYSNAFELWAYDNRFVEGLAVASDLVEQLLCLRNSESRRFECFVNSIFYAPSRRRWVH